MVCASGVPAANLSRVLDDPSPGDARALYAFGEEIGRGFFGVVRRCVDRRTGEQLACKVLEKARLRCRADAVAREVAVMRALAGHPGIVELKGEYEDAERIYIVMEYCGGGDLCDEINRRNKFSETDAAAVFRQLASAVAFCHSHGILHRDLKPENVLICSRDCSPSSHADDECEEEDSELGSWRSSEGNPSEGLRVKLADFGQAVCLRPGSKVIGACGSLFYLSPEQILGEQYGKEADIWSLGVVLAGLLTGRLPFPENASRDVMKRAICDGKINFRSSTWAEVSPGAVALVQRLLVVDPNRRISAEDILSDPWLLRASNPMLSTSCSSGFRIHVGFPTSSPMSNPLFPLAPAPQPTNIYLTVPQLGYGGHEPLEDPTGSDHGGEENEEPQVYSKQSVNLVKEALLSEALRCQEDELNHQSGNGSEDFEEERGEGEDDEEEEDSSDDDNSGRLLGFVKSSTSNSMSCITEYGTPGDRCHLENILVTEGEGPEASAEDATPRVRRVFDECCSMIAAASNACLSSLADPLSILKPRCSVIAAHQTDSHGKSEVAETLREMEEGERFECKRTGDVENGTEASSSPCFTEPSSTSSVPEGTDDVSVEGVTKKEAPCPWEWPWKCSRGDRDADRKRHRTAAECNAPGSFYAPFV